MTLFKELAEKVSIDGALEEKIRQFFIEMSEYGFSFEDFDSPELFSDFIDEKMQAGFEIDALNDLDVETLQDVLSDHNYSLLQDARNLMLDHYTNA